MRRAFGIALLMVVATAGLGFAQSIVSVTASTVNLRAEPTTNSAIVATLERGVELKVLATMGSWYKVVDSKSGKEGYVHSLTVKVVSGGTPPAAPAAAPTTPAAAPKPQAVRPAPVRRVAAPPRDFSDSGAMIMLRGGQFIASDSGFKDIYGTGQVFGAEFRYAPRRPGGPKIVGWLEGTMRQRTGKLSVTLEETKVTVNAVEGGAIYRINPGKITPYVGAGVGYYMFSETNTPLGDAKQNKVGFCALGGVSLTVGSRFVVDARAKFSSVSMKPADVDIKVGGITAGVGFGLLF